MHDRFRTAWRRYGVTLILMLIGVLWVELSLSPRLSAATLAVGAFIAIVGWQWMSRTWDAARVKQWVSAEDWELWLRLPRPRVVRIREETQVATISRVRKK
jgi:hypothetical protein